MCESADRVEQDWESDTADVVAFRERLGLPTLIDVHTHFMPKRVMDKVWAYFDSAGPLTGREWPIRYRMEEDTRVEHLRAFGVSHFTSMLYPHKPDMAAWLNQWAAEFADRTPDCLHTATFYPEESAPAYVTAALDAGTRVFKSHIQVGDYDPNDPLLDPVWGLLADSGTPIVIHCGSGPAPGRFTGPDRIATLLARHPRLALVIAHMGMPEYSEFLDLADRYPSVYLDTTMAFTDFTEAQIPFPRAELSRLRDLGERILFGSDYPNIPYSYRAALDALERFDLGDDWVRAVVHHNAARLFEIG
ncbi:Amidohydrolase-related domain-containing protein [Prescottella defluvii]|uniref:amidohydrolase family protein n=1 Tax=Prescottella defluvii TaxID=1323361 RepID=UPI00068E69F2|nr:amidohydrolase family protein [Prescottella defluvii]